MLLLKPLVLQEYIRPGMRMLFRDGRVRGVGIITHIHAPPVALKA